MIFLRLSNRGSGDRAAGEQWCNRREVATASRQNLAGMVFGKDVLVEWNKLDRYGRTVVVVLVNARDVNLEQVRAGMAWWYRQYAREQTPDDRHFYERAEAEARAAKRGLWVDPAPMPPWEFRREGRNLR